MSPFSDALCKEAHGREKTIGARMSVIFNAIAIVCTVIFTTAKIVRAENLIACTAQPVSKMFGVNAHLHNGLPSKHVALLKKAGFAWVRFDLGWDSIEKVPGVYDFSTFDQVVAALHNAGIGMVAILDYGNDLYDKEGPPISSAGRAAFARFAAAAANRYANNNIVWEIYNEPNDRGFWKPKPDVVQYITLADEVTTAIRKAVPKAGIVGPALSGPTAVGVLGPLDRSTRNFLDRVLASRAAHKWDGITVHPYRLGREAPEASRDQLNAVRQMMHEHGLDPTRVPLIAGEWGYSTAVGEIDERVQAAYAVRMLLWGALQRMPFTFWYDWQDDGPDPKEREHHFGLLRFDPLEEKSEPEIVKPAFQAIAQLSAMLKDYRLEAEVKDDDGVFVVRFAKDGHKAFAIWSTDNLPHHVEVELPSGDWSAVRLLEQPTELTVDKGHRVNLEAHVMPTVILPARTVQ